MVLDFFANLFGRIAEEKYLRDRCMYAGVPIKLDGVLISRKLPLDEEASGQVRLLGREFAGIVRIVIDDAPAVLHLIKDGVWIDSHPLPECGTNLIAVIEGERLRKDVSQARIVADDAVATIIAAIRRVRWQLWRQMQATLVPRHRPTTSTKPVWMRVSVKTNNPSIMRTVLLPKPANATSASSKPSTINANINPSAVTSAEYHSTVNRMSATTNNTRNKTISSVRIIQDYFQGVGTKHRLQCANIEVKPSIIMAPARSIYL
jgi:hypothetical protein